MSDWKEVVSNVTLLACLFSLFAPSSADKMICSDSQSWKPYCLCTSDTVDCNGQERTVVPSGIPKQATKIDLGDNDITMLMREDFNSLENIEVLDLSFNSIQSVERGTFDRLFRVKEIYLSDNSIKRIDSFYFLHLENLIKIDVSNNDIDTVAGNAFVTLPSVKEIDLTGNQLTCGCETRQLRQWLTVKRDRVRLNGLCKNINSTSITDIAMEHFGACTGNDLFPNHQSCHTCSGARSHRECLENNKTELCDGSDSNKPPVCYTEIQLLSNGVTFLKSCDAYQTCMDRSSKTNPSSCYTTSGVMNCVFCCIGDFCNDEDIGYRTKLIDFNVTFELNTELKAAYDYESTEYLLFQLNATKQIEKEIMKNVSFGTYDVQLNTLSTTTVQFTVECTTTQHIEEKNVMDYLISTINASRDLQTIAGFLTKTFSITTRYVCSSETMATWMGYYFWPSTTVDGTAQSDCIHAVDSRFAYRSCKLRNGIATWGSVNDTECGTPTTQASPTITNEPAQDLTRQPNISTVTQDMSLSCSKTNKHITQDLTKPSSQAGISKNIHNFTTLSSTSIITQDIAPLSSQTPTKIVIRGTITESIQDLTTRSNKKTTNNIQNVTTPWKETTTISKHTQDLKKIANLKITNGTSNVIASQLMNITTSAKEFSAADVSTTVSILDGLVAYNSYTSEPKRVTSIATIMNNFLDSQSSALSNSETKFKSASRFLDVIETFTKTLEFEGDNFTCIHPNLALFVIKSSEAANLGLSLQTTALPGQQLDADTVKFSEGTNDTKDASTMILPPTLSLELNDSEALSKVVFTVYASGKLFTAISKSTALDQGDVTEPYIRKPNSLVLSASIPNVKVENLKNLITLRFKHYQRNSGIPHCSFWENNTWSGRGCIVKETDDKQTVCECDHLTNFALLMDIYGVGGKTSPGHQKALSVVSYVGCGISIFGLLLTFVTYLSFKKIRSYNPSKVLINLCIALLGTNAIFLLGQQPYAFHSTSGCKTVAALLHFFLLSALTWMAVEAFYMYMALVKVFHSHISYFLLKTCVLGWGLPSTIVIITLGVKRTENYGLQPGDVCWLMPNAFYASFLVPVMLILFWNLISFVLVTRALWGSSATKIKKSVHSKTSTRFRRAVSLLVLLGLTWMFAIFAVDGGGIVFQYLFTIFNSLQGFLIFIFYCFLNKEAKKLWLKRLSCVKPYGSITSSQSSKETKSNQLISDKKNIRSTSI